MAKKAVFCIEKTEEQASNIARTLYERISDLPS